MPNSDDEESTGAPASKREQRQDRILDSLNTSSDEDWRKAWDSAEEKDRARDRWLQERLKGHKVNRDQK